MKRIPIKTRAKQELVDITAQVERAVRESGVATGSCEIFVPHTTAAITINENADPAVKEDILLALEKLIPQRGSYKHAEGNAHAHIKASLMGHSAHVFIEGGKLVLGTWQGIFLCEFDGPRERQVWLHIRAT